jgi:hypothetical protein
MPHDANPRKHRRSADRRRMTKTIKASAACYDCNRILGGGDDVVTRSHEDLRSTVRGTSRCKPRLRGLSMPSVNSQRQSTRGISRSGIIRTLLVQILVLLALGFAVVRYLEWSSDVNQAEFMSATKPSASDPNHSGAAPLHHGPCFPLF